MWSRDGLPVVFKDSGCVVVGAVVVLVEVEVDEVEEEEVEVDGSVFVSEGAVS